MLMNNLTDQTKLSFIKKRWASKHGSAQLCPQLLGPVKIHAKIKIQSKHIHTHTDHKQVHRYAHIAYMTLAHTQTLTPYNQTQARTLTFTANHMHSRPYTYTISNTLNSRILAAIGSVHT